MQASLNLLRLLLSLPSHIEKKGIFFDQIYDPSKYYVCIFGHPIYNLLLANVDNSNNTKRLKRLIVFSHHNYPKFFRHIGGTDYGTYRGLCRQSLADSSRHRLYGVLLRNNRTFSSSDHRYSFLHIK